MEKVVVMENIYNVDAHESPALLPTVHLDNNGCLEVVKKSI